MNTAPSMSASLPKHVSIRRSRILLQTARIVSRVFSPFYFTLYACALILTLSHLSYLPLAFRIMMLSVVWLFSVALPRVLIRLYLRIYKLPKHALAERKKRILPYILTTACYMALLHVLTALQTAHLLTSVLMVAVAVLLVCLLINLFYKISSHAASVGGATGLFMGLSLIYAFEATGWICLCVLVVGLVCTSRIMLRRHSLGETALGAGLGFVIALACAILL